MSNEKVPLDGTMTKRQLKRLMDENRWDVIGAYFEFKPGFLTLPSRKPMFDWATCPDSMASVLKQDSKPVAIATIAKGTTIRRATFIQQNGECFYCGEETEWADWTVDHMIPKSRSRCRGHKNQVGACATCNHAKGNMTFDEFLTTNYLPEMRRAVLGFAKPPTIKYQEARKQHEARRSQTIKPEALASRPGITNMRFPPSETNMRLV